MHLHTVVVIYDQILVNNGIHNKCYSHCRIPDARFNILGDSFAYDLLKAMFDTTEFVYYPAQVDLQIVLYNYNC